MEKANDAFLVRVRVPQQEEQAVDRVDGAVTPNPKERDPDADQGPHVEVEEADVPAQVGVAWIKAVPLGEHHPAPRVEARIGDATAARGSGAGPPAGADGSEADVVQKVTGQQARCHGANQIFRQRRPVRSTAILGVAALCPRRRHRRRRGRQQHRYLVTARLSDPQGQQSKQK